jgi:4'-phosphopantetheinyl transferase
MTGVRIFHCTPPDDFRSLAEAWGYLDEAEKARSRSFRFDRDRIGYVTAHALLRAALADMTGWHPAELRFDAGPHGKPGLLPSQQRGCRVHFSLSHAPGRVGCAIARGGDVGFDIEEVRLPAPLEVAERFFSPAEVAHLRGLPPGEQEERFYVLWTLKEAYLKARGCGLSLPLGSFSLVPTPDAGAQLTLAEPDRHTPSWSFRQWRLGSHQMALAADAGAGPLRVTLTETLQI